MKKQPKMIHQIKGKGKKNSFLSRLKDFDERERHSKQNMKELRKSMENIQRMINKSLQIIKDSKQHNRMKTQLQNSIEKNKQSFLDKPKNRKIKIVGSRISNQNQTVRKKLNYGRQHKKSIEKSQESTAKKQSNNWKRYNGKPLTFTSTLNATKNKINENTNTEKATFYSRLESKALCFEKDSKKKISVRLRTSKGLDSSYEQSLSTQSPKVVQIQLPNKNNSKEIGNQKILIDDPFNFKDKKYINRQYRCKTQEFYDSDDQSIYFTPQKNNDDQFSEQNPRKKDFILKIKKYGFVQKYLCKEEIDSIYENLMKSGIPESRWPLVVVDEVHKKNKIKRMVK